MNFHIISDIHLEFRYYSLTSHVNKKNRKGIPDNEQINLILAGDVGYPEQQTFRDFIKSVSNLYDHIFMVIGNHEYYKKDIETTKQKVREICSPYNNVHLLDNEMMEYNDIYIIGSTLWTYVSENDPARKTPINDYKFISGFTIEQSNTLFEESKAFLDQSIEICIAKQKKCIVITHHIPSFSLIHPIYKGNPINSYFASECDDLIKPPVQLWVYGHTHHKTNRHINGVELICNPKGYPDELSGYSKTIVYKVK